MQRPALALKLARLAGTRVEAEEIAKIAKVAVQVIVKTEKEVDVKDGVASLAALKAGASPEDAARQQQEPQQPAHKPTLRREGEQAEPTLQLPTDGQPQPAHPAEPEWGTGGKPGEKQPASQEPQKPPQH